MGLFSQKKQGQQLGAVNGHPVISHVPGIYMHRTSNGEAVRIELVDEFSPLGVSSLYVHKNCVQYMGGEYAQSMYRVMLIDRDYILYDAYDDGKGGLLMEEQPDRVSVEDVITMVQDTQYEYMRMAPKMRRLDKSIEATPRDMISFDYIDRDDSKDAMSL